MKKTYLILFLILFNKQFTAQVMSKDSLWIDDFFDTFDLVIVPEYCFTYTNYYINSLEGKKIDVLNNNYVYLTDVTEHILNKKISTNALQGGKVTVGLKSKKIDFFVSYYTGWNQFRDYSYDTPYYSTKNKKIGDIQLTTNQLQINTHYWLNDIYGVGLEYDIAQSSLKIDKILTNNKDGLFSQPLIGFSINHHSLYLYTPIKYKIDKFNVNFLAGLTLFTSSEGSILIETNPQYSRDFNSPFGLRLNLGVNTKLFNYLQFGIMYKFNYLTSKDEYSFMTNTISLQIGIPEL